MKFQNIKLILIQIFWINKLIQKVFVPQLSFRDKTYFNTNVSELSQSCLIDNVNSNSKRDLC